MQPSLIDSTSKLASTQLQSYKGEDKLFNNRMSAFFADTSYERHAQQKKALKTLLSCLPSKFTELEEQSRIKHEAQVRRETNDHWNRIKAAALNLYENQQESCIKAAVIIQRCVRGFLTRIKIEGYVVDQRQERTEFLIQECEDVANVCLFHLGLMVDEAAIVIQNGVRRYLMRLRYYRLIKTYQYFLEEKTKNANEVIRRFMLKFACKERIKSIIFEKYREKRLAEIRENLALLRLKRYWKKKKLSFRIIKDKLLRLKRRKTALANKEAFQKLLASSGGKNTRPPILRSQTKTTNFEDDDFDDDPDGMNREEQQRALEEQMEAERIKEENHRKLREKIEICKLAYGMKTEKDVVVIPFLQERELNENISNSLEVRLYETTTCAYSKTVKSERTEFPKVRNTMINSSPTATHKRMFSDSCSLPPLLLVPSVYTKKKSFRQLASNPDPPDFLTEKRRCRHKRNSLSLSYQPNPSHKHFHLENSFMFKNTLSSVLKKQEKKAENPAGKKWKMGRRNSEYTPGLDNSAFTPVMWRPVKLNKSILETNNSSGFVRSINQMASKPTSIVSFSSVIMGKKPRWSELFSVSPSTHEGSTDLIPYDIETHKN